MKQMIARLPHGLLLLILLVGCLRNVNGACEKTLVGVDLDECPLPVFDHRENPTTEADPVRVEYLTAKWEFPALDAATHQVIPNSFVTMVQKVYKFNDMEPNFPSPTMIWEKGAVLHMELINSIYKNPDENNSTNVLPDIDWDEHWYAINIHTHGLHISSFEDDPSISILAGESRAYVFNLPENHAGGIHWYHPHVEGIGEYLAAGGVAGALIVEDDPFGTEIPLDILDLKTNVLVIQKIFPGKLKDLQDGYIGATDFINQLFPRRDMNDPTFKLEYDESLLDSSRLNETTTFYTFVNGYIKPKLTLVSGRWHRLRMLFVGGDDPDAILADGMFYIGKNPKSNGPSPDTTCETMLIGKDGVYLPKSRRLDFNGTTRIWLHSASRTEILVKCDFIESSTATRESLDQWLVMDVPSRRNDGVPLDSIGVLNFKVISNEETEASNEQSAILQQTQDFTINSCLPSYLPDMTGDDVEIYPIAPFSSTVGNIEEVNETIRENTFSEFYNETAVMLDLEVSPFDMNGMPFRGWEDETTKNISVFELQKVYQMRLIHGGHPLHIHVNHMQLQHDGVEVNNYHKKGDFVDTISSPCPNSDENCANFEPRFDTERTIFRMFVDRFDGLMLMHCHNLDHSDSGALATSWVLPTTAEVLAAVVAAAKWENQCSSQIHVSSESFTPDVSFLSLNTLEVDSSKTLRVISDGTDLTWRVNGELIDGYSGSSITIDSSEMDSNSYVRIDIYKHGESVADNTVFFKTLKILDLSDDISISSLPTSLTAFTDTLTLEIEGSSNALSEVSKVCYHVKYSDGFDLILVCADGDDSIDVALPYPPLSSASSEDIEIFAELLSADEVHLGTTSEVSITLNKQTFDLSSFQDTWGDHSSANNHLWPIVAASAAVPDLNEHQRSLEAYQLFDFLQQAIFSGSDVPAEIEMEQAEYAMRVILDSLDSKHSVLAAKSLEVLKQITDDAFEILQQQNVEAFGSSSGAVTSGYDSTLISDLLETAFTSIDLVESTASSESFDAFIALEASLPNIIKLGSYFHNDWTVDVTSHGFGAVSERMSLDEISLPVLVGDSVQVTSISHQDSTADLVFSVYSRPASEPLTTVLRDLSAGNDDDTVTVRSKIVNFNLWAINENNMEATLSGDELVDVDSFDADVYFDVNWQVDQQSYVFCAIVSDDYSSQQTSPAIFVEGQIKCSFDAVQGSFAYILEAIPSV